MTLTSNDVRLDDVDVRSYDHISNQGTVVQKHVKGCNIQERTV